MKNKLYLYTVKQLNITVMRQSFYPFIMVTLFFIILGVFGVYLNFSDNTPNYKTGLFIVVLGGLYYTSHKLIQRSIKKRHDKLFK